MKAVFLAIATLLYVYAASQPDTTQKIIAGRRNSPSQQQKLYLIMISADGFRHDYAEKHGASFLQRIGRKNVKADYMLPSFPSLTFPNHYTLATGLYPSHHGLVDNHFYEPSSNESYSMSRSEKVSNRKWYGGMPLWVLAEEQGMLAASFYWVGTEAPIQGVRPTYYYQYNERISIDKRIQTVVDWLQLPEDQRPHFISFYFPEIDHAGHDYGPDAPETGKAVRFVDSALQKLTEAVAQTGLQVNYIFTSDHGMTPVDTVNRVLLPSIDTSIAKMVWGGELAHIYLKDKGALTTLYDNLKRNANGYQVLLKNETPKKWHYRQKDDMYNRIGDILLIPYWPQVFSSAGRRVKPGAHGFDPYAVQDMRTVFYAWGPAFKEQKSVGHFLNVDVYPVAASVLDLPYSHKIDGKKKLSRKVLKR